MSLYPTIVHSPGVTSLPGLWHSTFIAVSLFIAGVLIIRHALKGDDQ